jgi:hypothetical protein
MLSHDSQLRVEQELKRLRRGFTCNVQRLNRWATYLNQRACHEDLYDAGGLIVEDSLVQEAMQWDGPIEIQPTYDEVTVVLRAKVVWLVEEYFERVLFMVAGELATLPMLARDFNTQLANVHRLLMSGYPGLLREADNTLCTDFDSKPPGVDLAAVLDQKLKERMRFDYASALFSDNRSETPELTTAVSVDLCVQPNRAELEPATDSLQMGGSQRRAAVDVFIQKCRQETSLNATRTHIWRAVGHRSPRQFQFWQASGPKATAQDDRNFRRILAMKSTEFVALLKTKGII